jgi:M6 family metalloprotease-like protein
MKPRFYLKLVTFLVCIASIQTLYARPALRTPINVVQPDGTTLKVRLLGDEFGHRTLTEDGFVLLQDDNGYYRFAIQKPDGTLQSSDFIARNPDSRNAKTKSFLKKQPKGVDYSTKFKSIQLENRLQRSTMKVGTSLLQTRAQAKSANISPGLLNDYQRTGTVKSLVILVNFSDVSMKSENTASAFWNMLNQSGYNQGYHVGSVRDYYQYNSGGLFSPEFDVVGPVTLSKAVSYYGANDNYGNDLHPELMIKEACVLADESVDFSQYDADNDGYVDNIYVYYAGYGEADGGASTTIWPHSSSLASLSLTLDGKKIGSYACSNEINGQTLELDGIGVFAHEFGHVLGLPDMYDVDYDSYNGEGFDINYWSLMAYGSYNGNSSVPPCLTIVERSILGWVTPTILSTTQDVVLEDLGSSNAGYKIESKKSGEYFLLENRQTDKNIWDSYLPYHGMLIYHVDMRDNDSIVLNWYGTKYKFSYADCWSYNMVNASSTHQCCDLEEADNKQTFYTNSYTAYINGLKGDPFPGTSGNTSFTNSSKPSSQSWDGDNLMSPVTEIEENDGIIAFNFTKEIVFAPTALSATSVLPYSFQCNWESASYAVNYLLDVFTVDAATHDTTYLTGLKDLSVSTNQVLISNLEDNTAYYYRVRGSNGTINSAYSEVIAVTTQRADDISCYVTNRVIWLKGMDKNSTLTVRNNVGLVIYSVQNNHIAVEPGFYLVSGSYKGNTKTFKVLVQ